MSPETSVSQLLSPVAIFIPIVCSGVMFAGTIYFAYVHKRSREPLHLAVSLLSLVAFLFVFSEGMILYFGTILRDVILGRQFHRLEQVAGSLFLVTLPFFLGHFLKLRGRTKTLNDGVVITMLVVVGFLTAAAFVKPDLFISQETGHPGMLDFPGDFGRGKEGVLYLPRDALFAPLFLYSLVLTVREILKKRDLPYLGPMLAGLLIAVFQAIDDIVYIHSRNHIGPFPDLIYSRFTLGLTLFVLLSMAAIAKRFIDEAKQTEYANAALEKSRKELLFLAYHDPLTGLRNRKAFAERLEESLAVAERSETEDLRGLLVFDCEGYQDLRDRLGHDIGDKLITETANRLKNMKRRSDLLFRTDSDEFALILSGIKTETDCVFVAEKIVNAIRKPYVFESHTLYLSPRVGIAVFPKDASDAPTLIRNAGAALVEAKSERSDYHFYTGSLHQKALDRINLLHALQHALESGQFELYYQPQINEGKALVGAEALIRWRHPMLGSVSPGNFIPLAEETGLIVPLGRWVLREACRQAREWRAGGIDVPVSVNLSTQQMRDKKLPALVEQTIRENDLLPEHLHLEITESSLMEDLDKNLKTLHLIREMGCRFSIDDFGTGYSSLSYLKRLPVHGIKIDRSFVIGLPEDAQDCALVKAIISMAVGLDLEVVAEGVDKEAQLQFLHAGGCGIIQGYLYSKPVPYEEFTSFARKPILPKRDPI